VNYTLFCQNIAYIPFPGRDYILPMNGACIVQASIICCHTWHDYIDTYNKVSPHLELILLSKLTMTGR